MTPEEIPLTLGQRKLMLHALGSPKGKIGWRNHFCAGPMDFPKWSTLVELGCAYKSWSHPVSASEQTFSVTDDGIRALGYDPDILKNPIKVMI